MTIGNEYIFVFGDQSFRGRLLHENDLWITVITLFPEIKWHIKVKELKAWAEIEPKK